MAGNAGRRGMGQAFGMSIGSSLRNCKPSAISSLFSVESVPEELLYPATGIADSATGRWPFCSGGRS
jgi:hypothetical protein